MPTFEYTALDVKGKNKIGTIESETLKSAQQKLRDLKLYPISIKEIEYADLKQKKKGANGVKGSSFVKIKAAELSVLTRQLAILVAAGFPLLGALKTLVPQAKTKSFKRVLSKLKDSIEEGKTLADSLSLFPHVFQPVYVNMVKAGEASGTLGIVLEKLADIIEKEHEFNHKIRSALAYPIFMLFIGFIVLFLLMTFIIPNITSIFVDMDQALPTPTRIMIALSDFCKEYWWVIVLFLFLAVFCFNLFKKTKAGKYLLDKIVLKIPIVGSLVQKTAAVNMCRTLGSLLENGVPVLTSLGIVKNVVNNVHFSNLIEHASSEVEKGIELNVALDSSSSSSLPYLAIQMIKVGEQSGELESMLKKISDVFEKEVENTISGFTSLLEPMIMLVMALIVSFVVFSICLPIFEMNELIK